MKKYFLLTLCMALTMILFCGCGNSENQMTSGSETTTQTQNSNESNNGNSNNDSNNNNNGSDNGGAGNGIVGGAADAVEDVAEGVGNGLKDVADGAANTVSGAFNNFDDAQDWFMNQLPSENGRFEVKNNDKDLTEYTNGRKGYHIELHDNNQTGNTKVGDFYIDAENGKVYRSDEHGKTFAEYDFSEYK